MSEMAAAIGETDDAARYAQLADEVKASFAARYVAADGTILGNSETGYAMVIGMDLSPAELLGNVGDKFVAKIASRDYHLSTGFLGTPWLLPALTKTGHQDIAYRLLNNESYPSWGYEVASGATTMWERWDSLRPDGSFGDVGMNSFNHYAYGAVGDWMYQNIGGITATGAGYKTFDIAPSVGGGLTHGKGTFESVFGTITSDWSTTESGLALAVTVPVNTTASVRIPAANQWSVTEGGEPLTPGDGITVESVENGMVTLSVGSGSYAFSSDPANSGVMVEIVPATDSSLPGETVSGVVRVTNTGTKDVNHFSVDLTLPGSLEVSPSQVNTPGIDSGQSREVPFSVDLPGTFPQGDVTITGTVNLEIGGESREYSTAVKLVTVLPAIAIDSLVAVASTEDSPTVATVTAVVSNAARSAITGVLVVDVPCGWPEPTDAPSVSVPAGGTVSVDAVVPIPLSVNAGLTTLTARFVHAETTLVSAQAAINVTLATPPAVSTDHVDLGAAASESAHNVTSSGNGGTTTEAGLTRRYSGLNDVGSWFAFDLAVTPGEPFLIRAIKMFDREQVKSYDILVNGVLIDLRRYQRNNTAAGLVTYQLWVPDDGTLTSTGTVNIRFRFNGLGSHDPSIADVWTLPVPAAGVAVVEPVETF